jgi:hypothetical protein
MDTESDSNDSLPTIRDLEVVAWRRHQLLAAGFDLPLSEALARDCGLDVHALLELVERGCNPKIAARILAPAEWEHRAC